MYRLLVRGSSHDVVDLTVWATSPYLIEGASIRLKLAPRVVEMDVGNKVRRCLRVRRTASGRRSPPGAPRFDQ